MYTGSGRKPYIQWGCHSCSLAQVRSRGYKRSREEQGSKSLRKGNALARCKSESMCVASVLRKTCQTPLPRQSLPPFHRPRSGQAVQRWRGKVKELVEQSIEPSSFFSGRRHVSPSRRAGVVADRRYSAAVRGIVATCGSCARTRPCPG